MRSYLLVLWVPLCSPISCFCFFPLALSLFNSHFVNSFLFLPSTLTFSNNSSLWARLAFRPTSLLVVFTSFCIKKSSIFLLEKFLESLLHSDPLLRDSWSFQAPYYCEDLHLGGSLLISRESAFCLILLFWWLTFARITPLLFFLTIIKMFFI